MENELPTCVSDPIVIVGQPRSGSTILTRVLNDDPKMFLVNDFYVLQKIDAADLWEPLSSEEAFRIAQWVYRILEIRCTQEVGKTLEQSIHLSLEDLGAIKDRACGQWPVGLLWSDVLSVLFNHAAGLAGATRWGWNTPQDHQHLRRIFSAFPNARIVCQLRAPENVLASYKNVKGWWHDTRRYNPLMLGYAWKKAAQNAEYWQVTRPNQFLFLKYEDLVNKTSEISAQLSVFLHLDSLPGSLEGFGNNSSMVGLNKRKPVTGLEGWLAAKVCGETALRLGFFAPKRDRIKITDFIEVAKIVAGNVSILATDYLFDSDRRKRVMNLLFRT